MQIARERTSEEGGGIFVVDVYRISEIDFIFYFFFFLTRHGLQNVLFGSFWSAVYNTRIYIVYSRR